MGQSPPVGVVANPSPHRRLSRAANKKVYPVSSTLRLKIAQYVAAALPGMVKALKEGGVIWNDAADDKTNAEEERLTEQVLREMATACLFVADQDTARLKSDMDSGEYRETVEKIVDGVVEDIKAGHFTRRADATASVAAAVLNHRYINDPELNILVLKYGTHPSSFHHRRRTFSPVTPIPWKEMANWCMQDDCQEELDRRAEFQALPTK